ncbi:hypothetical protein [Paenibacillus taiwanensis]|uniref:hypothetical protein n=1 Tax=Paenibacillus taiwanensis TaxID=401638 RepID=UPI000417DA2B|nr:hypothetical protein [Paenibacillus taiwanensis]
MESIIRYVPKHIDGYFLTLRCEPTDSLKAAANFSHEEDLDGFMKGMYGPVDPLNYTYERMVITFELEAKQRGTNTEGAA